MECIMLVSLDVYNQLKENEVVIAKNENPICKQSYDVLKEISHYDGLFFAIENNDYVKQNEHLLQEILKASNADNCVQLVVNVENYIKHDYYTFCDLIYTINEEYDEDVYQHIVRLLKQNDCRGMINQIVFEELRISDVRVS